MEKLREGKWKMPWGTMEIDSTNYEAFLKEYNRVEEEENTFILQDVPQGKPGYRRLFG